MITPGPSIPVPCAVSYWYFVNDHPPLASPRGLDGGRALARCVRRTRLLSRDRESVLGTYFS